MASKTTGAFWYSSTHTGAPPATKVGRVRGHGVSCRRVVQVQQGRPASVGYEAQEGGLPHRSWTSSRSSASGRTRRATTPDRVGGTDRYQEREIWSHRKVRNGGSQMRDVEQPEGEDRRMTAVQADPAQPLSLR